MRWIARSWADILPLERDGLIRIEATIPDRRAKELHLTKAGEKRLQAAHERWSEAQARFETTFGPGGAGRAVENAPGCGWKRIGLLMVVVLETEDCC